MRTFLTTLLFTISALMFTNMAHATPFVKQSTSETTAETTIAKTPMASSVLNAKQQRKAARKAKRVARWQKRLVKWQERAASDSEVAAIVAYLTIFGFLISLLALHEEGDEYSAFHLRQALGLALVGVALSLAGFILLFIPLIGGIVIGVFYLVLLIAFIISLIRAISGSTEPIFLFGEKFQDWFSGIQ